MPFLFGSSSWQPSCSKLSKQLVPHSVGVGCAAICFEKSLALLKLFGPGSFPTICRHDYEIP